MPSNTYPNQVIPSNPSDANFESDFRANTETLQQATKNIDDEVLVARGNFANLNARLSAIMTADGVLSVQAPTAGFWTDRTSATGSSGSNQFTETGDFVNIYTRNRPVRLTTASGTQYTHIDASSYDSNTNTTTVTLLVSANASVNAIAIATQEKNNLWKIDSTDVSSTFFDPALEDSIAMSIALS